MPLLCRAVQLLLLLQCAEASLDDYYVYPGRIGPEAEQHNMSEHFSCTTEPSCANETATKCDATAWCHSFAIMHKSKYSQIYRADYNQSLPPPHPKWTFYSHSKAPPTPPTPPTPSPPGPGPAPVSKIDYCGVKSLAYEYAKKLMPGKDLSAVFDALQLGAKCNQTYRSGSDITSQAGRAAASLPADAIFVDAAKGDDTKDGTEAEPVKTIARALTLSRSSSPPRKAILLRGGTFYLLSTLELDEQDDGLAISSYPNERATISGGVLLEGLHFQPVPSPLPGGGGDKIKVATLTDVCSPSLPDFHTLFVGGRRAIRARYPNANPETQGLHTPASGYLGPSNAAVGGHRKQQCTQVAASTCPFEIPNFGYGKFHGANESGAGYVPSFEPYWCGGWTGISSFSPKEGATPGAHFESWNASQLAGGGATLHMTRGTRDIWANFQWQVEGLDRNDSASSAGGTTLRLGKGGVQFPRGTGSTGWWFIDGVLAELDSPNEWLYNPPSSRLYWWPNTTAADNSSAPELVATRLKTLVRVVGARVQLSNLTFAHTDRTVLEPYETPAGGGYSVHRGAMVELRDIGASGATVARCTFDSPGGNGVLVEGRSPGVSIVDNEFKWVGDSAIVVLGRTEGCDARGEKGHVPVGTLVASNLIHEVGVWGKQGTGYFQSLSMNSTLTGNLIFNGPRAGVLWDDGLGGGNRMTNNLLFNLVRETTDHGPFNSWDRVPFVTDAPGGGAQVGPRMNSISRNFVICNYQCTWPIDHDDGSNHYNDTYNALFFGGAKNYLGAHKRSEHNLYIYPDAKPTEDNRGVGGNGIHKAVCANNDGAKRNSSGYDEVWANNRCIIANGGSTYAYDKCDPQNPSGTVDETANNTFYTAGGDVTIKCASKTWTLGEYQQRGFDLGSKVLPPPTTDEIFGWVRELLGF